MEEYYWDLNFHLNYSHFTKCFRIFLFVYLMWRYVCLPLALIHHIYYPLPFCPYPFLSPIFHQILSCSQILAPAIGIGFFKRLETNVIVSQKYPSVLFCWLKWFHVWLECYRLVFWLVFLWDFLLVLALKSELYKV